MVCSCRNCAGATGDNPSPVKKGYKKYTCCQMLPEGGIIHTLDGSERSEQINGSLLAQGAFLFFKRQETVIMLPARLTG